jgi:hypothetical protein
VRHDTKREICPENVRTVLALNRIMHFCLLLPADAKVLMKTSLHAEEKSDRIVISNTIALSLLAFLFSNTRLNTHGTEITSRLTWDCIVIHACILC